MTDFSKHEPQGTPEGQPEASGQYASPYGQYPPQGQYPPPGYPPPGYPSPGYAPPGYPPGYYPPMSRGTNGLAIASMVLGILWVYWIGSVLAIVFGFVARNQIRQRGQGGDGMAVAGIVLGIVGVAAFVLLLIIGVGVSTTYN